MSSYNANDYQLKLVENNQQLQVVNIDTDETVETYYIGPKEGAVCISYLDSEILVATCTLPPTYDSWPLANYDFVRNREGGILAVDIRNFMSSDECVVVVTYNLTIAGSTLKLQIDDHQNLLTNYSIS